MSAINEGQIEVKYKVPQATSPLPDQCGCCGSEMASLAYFAKSKVGIFDLRTSLPAAICSKGGTPEGNGLCGGISFAIGTYTAKRIELDRIMEVLYQTEIVKGPSRKQKRKRSISQREQR